MTACVGRARELAWMTARLEATSARGTAMVAVTGPPGIGKSRAVDELREQCRAAGFPVFEGWCVRCAAYAPFMAIAAQALAWLRDRDEQDLLGPGDLDALAPLVNARAVRAVTAPEGTDSPDDESAVRFTEALTRLLAAVSRTRPALLLLRGWSRADEATRSLVRSLLDTAGPVGEPTPGAPSALLVVSLRNDDALPEFLSHPRVESLALEGLGPDGVRQLLQDDALVARLHAVTVGNPEALLALLDRPAPPRDAEVCARVDALGELARQVVLALAVADRPLPPHVLAVALGVDASSVLRAVPALVGAGVVRRVLDPGVGDVVLALARQDDGAAVRSATDGPSLARLEGALGDALDQWGRVSPEEAVQHQLLGAPSPEVAARAVSVARALLRRHAPAAALALLQHAAPYCRADMLRELGRLAAAAGHTLGAFDAARALVTRAEEANADDPELARLHGTLSLAAADFAHAEEALDRADARTPADDARQRAANAATRAELRYQQGRLDETESLARAAIDGCPDDDDTITQARNTLTKVFLVRRELDKGWDWSVQSIERARARRATNEVLRGLINLGVVSIWRGDLDEAVRQFEAARGVSQRGGSMMLRGVLRENEAVVAHLQGRYGDALSSYQEALGILTRVGNRRFVARVAHNLGELYVHVGEVARARRLCDYAAQVAGGVGGALSAEGLMLRAQVEIADGRTDAARAALADALGLFVAAGDAERQGHAHTLLARAALVDGDLDRAAASLGALAEEASLSPRTRAERWLLDAELVRGRGGDPFGAARKALELAEGTQDVDLRFRAQVAVAMALLDRGDEPAARRHAVQAQALREVLLAKVPEGLRGVYATELGRTGVDALASRLELLAARPAVAATARAASVAVDTMGLVGDSAALRELRRRIARVAPQDVTVLLRGESGTGKERVAEALHHGSRRRSAPLVKVNCAALAEGVLLSELFGHERGAFTGADRRRRGRFEMADGGTIFLDEIGDISAATQAALLRVLQERTFERVGGNETHQVDVRIVAATNRDLAQMVKANAFREDLYYRLTSLTIALPPLRDRLEDLPLLAAYVLEREARAMGGKPRKLAPSALRRLAEHPWPGNIRELENVLRASALFADDDEIAADDLQGLGPRAVTDTAAAMAPLTPAPGAAPRERTEVEVVYERIRHGGVSLFDMRRDLERGCIAHALEESQGNITRAAALLGMKRPRLSQLVREYGLAKGHDSGDTPLE
jgi:DNA-binding NtrC family response regulator/tetratricopeptide (TPR) repeat protein